MPAVKKNLCGWVKNCRKKPNGCANCELYKNYKDYNYNEASVQIDKINIKLM